MKLEPVFDVGCDFDREGRVLRRATGYRQHRHMRTIGARSVFLALVAPPDARDSET